MVIAEKAGDTFSPMWGRVFRYVQAIHNNPTVKCPLLYPGYVGKIKSLLNCLAPVLRQIISCSVVVTMYGICVLTLVLISTWVPQVSKTTSSFHYSIILSCCHHPVVLPSSSCHPASRHPTIILPSFCCHLFILSSSYHPALLIVILP